MRCPYRCHEIGGPWIAENPECPVHNRDAVAERERVEREIDEVLQRLDSVESRLRQLEATVRQKS